MSQYHTLHLFAIILLLLFFSHTSNSSTMSDNREPRESSTIANVTGQQGEGAELRETDSDLSDDETRNRREQIRAEAKRKLAAKLVKITLGRKGSCLFPGNWTMKTDKVCYHWKRVSFRCLQHHTMVRMNVTSTRRILGHSLVHWLVCTAHSFACFARSIPSSWDRGYCL